VRSVVRPRCGRSLAGVCRYAVAGLNYKTLTAIGETRLDMLDNVDAALFSIALNVILIPRTPSLALLSRPSSLISG
jgi:O-antigen/teichoic acid export membrane protein